MHVVFQHFLDDLFHLLREKDGKITHFHEVLPRLLVDPRWAYPLPYELRRIRLGGSNEVEIGIRFPSDAFQDAPNLLKSSRSKARTAILSETTTLFMGSEAVLSICSFRALIRFCHGAGKDGPKGQRLTAPWITCGDLRRAKSKRICNQRFSGPKENHRLYYFTMLPLLIQILSVTATGAPGKSL